MSQVINLAERMNGMIADRAKERLGGMLSPQQLRDFEIAREKAKITDAMRTISGSLKTLRGYITENQIDTYVVMLQEMLPKMVGGKS
jgi:hypothetical protein